MMDEEFQQFKEWAKANASSLDFVQDRVLRNVAENYERYLLCCGDKQTKEEVRGRFHRTHAKWRPEYHR